MIHKLIEKFYCKDCVEHTNTCLKKRICVHYVRFHLENERLSRLNRQECMELTVSDVVMLYGRFAALKIMGQKEMVTRLEPIVEKYRELWASKNFGEEDIQSWLSTLPADKAEEIRDDMDFFTKKVGLFLSDHSDVLI